MSLIELPSNTGQVYGVDPHHVTAVAPYHSTLPGKGGQIFPMSIVWLQDRSLFVCAWSTEQTLEVLNAARHGEAALFAAGYRAGIADDRMIDDVELAWTTYLEARHAG